MSPLSGLARVVSTRPVASLVVLLVASVVLGSFAVRLEQSASFDAFETDDDAAGTLATVGSDFGTGGATLQVLLDAGPDGDVLSAAALDDVAVVEDAVVSVLGDRAVSEEQAFVSFAEPVRAALEQVGADGGAADTSDEAVRAAASIVLGSPAGAQLAGLLSVEDPDASDPRSRAALAVVSLSADLDDEAAADAAVEVRDEVDRLDLAELSTQVIGEPLLQRASAELTGAELPRLLGLSVVLIALLLALVLRRVSDVLISLGALALALVWTFGIGSLLGPGWLGWTGPFNQITTVVPVLVAGLGIDFALHLVTRDREEQVRRRAERGVAVAVVAVGGALVLTSVTTAVGFLTNLASPLAPIRDFGVFTAVGVVCAFVVMVVAVPSARTLLDRRDESSDGGSDRASDRASGGSSDGGSDGSAGRSEQEGAPLPFVGPVARTARTHPVAVLVVTGGLTAAAFVAAMSVPTEFSTDDFAPDEGRVVAALDQVEELFGEEVSERTFVLLDGPLTDVEVARRVVGLTEALAGVDGVRSALGRALVESPATVLAQVSAVDPQLAEELAAMGWTGQRFEDDADVAGVYEAVERAAPERAAQVLEPDGDRQLLVLQTAASQSGAPALQDRLRSELEPVSAAGVSVAVTSQELVFSNTLDALTESQLRSIAITISVAALLLAGYFRWRAGSWLLGLVAMLPTVLVAIWVVGTMWLLELSFNVLTITIGSLAIAIGVDYGIHVVHRFHAECEHRERTEAIQHTIEQTGGALAGSAATTVAGFGVLMLSSILPIRQFGIITALTIVYSLVAAIAVLPAVLEVFSARSARGGSGRSQVG